MATIQCNEIQQNINYLLTAFADCNKIKNEDLQILVELVAAVNECANGGPPYNTEIQEFFNPAVVDEPVSYPPNSFHSISIMILSGFITQNIDGNTVTFPKGTSLNTEYTTLNQTSFEFIVKAGAQVVVSYLIETI